MRSGTDENRFVDDCRRVGLEERSGADVWKAVAVATTAASSVASRRRLWIIINAVSTIIDKYDFNGVLKALVRWPTWCGGRRRVSAVFFCSTRQKSSVCRRGSKGEETRERAERQGGP